jgi:hypothetical protein
MKPRPRIRLESRHDVFFCRRIGRLTKIVAQGVPEDKTQIRVMIPFRRDKTAS